MKGIFPFGQTGYSAALFHASGVTRSPHRCEGGGIPLQTGTNDVGDPEIAAGGGEDQSNESPRFPRRGQGTGLRTLPGVRAQVTRRAVFHLAKSIKQTFSLSVHRVNSKALRTESRLPEAQAVDLARSP